MSYKLSLLILIACLALPLTAVKLRYKVISMRLNVADIEMELQDPEIHLAVRSRIKLPLFPYLNNRYQIRHDKDYLPQWYLRLVDQSEISDSVYTEYKNGNATMHQRSTGRSTTYKLRTNTRDIFSLLAKISSDPQAGGTYYVDGNSRIWQVNVSRGKTEQISTALGKYTARRHEFSFVALSPTKAPYIDMLTFNFLDPDTKLTLWISAHGIPLKAYLKKNFTSMSWEIQSIGQ